ncbi:MAG: hypothetical protein WBS15_10365 [Mycobacterium sp.]
MFECETHRYPDGKPPNGVVVDHIDSVNTPEAVMVDPIANRVDIEAPVPIAGTAGLNSGGPHRVRLAELVNLPAA